LILVDTSILVDILARNSQWSEWSLDQLELAAARDNIALNDIIYAELAAGPRHIADLDAALWTLGMDHVPIPRAALFLAGQAFRMYRRQNGTKSGVLPDFFIGAHAVATDAPLLTRDPRRIRSYFPSVTVISP
jgi:predicted nucleic acid-binding protein